MNYITDKQLEEDLRDYVPMKGLGNPELMLLYNVENTKDPRYDYSEVLAKRTRMQRAIHKFKKWYHKTERAK